MNDWEKELLDELKSYTDEVTEDVKDAVVAVGKETVKKLKKNSPKRTGDYKKGWRVKTTTNNAALKEVVVHNKTNYQLTHLLEKGHANHDGTFTNPKPHIEKAEKEAIKDLEDKIRVVIEG